MIDLSQYLPPDEEAVAQLSPEELAGALLAALRSIREPFDLHDVIQLSSGIYQKNRSKILFSLGEALAYLKSECFVVPYPPELHNYANKDIIRYRLSERGKRVDLAQNMKAFRESKLLPRDLLHPSLVANCLPLFIRGDYETAVFRAMKEVEVTVRQTAGLPNEQVGVPLMRNAFGSNGSLGKVLKIKSESEALCHLFAGAMGYFRNSTGHRNVELTPEEAAQAIIFASHLLLVVERLSNTKKTNNESDT